MGLFMYIGSYKYFELKYILQFFIRLQTEYNEEYMRNIMHYI